MEKRTFRHSILLLILYCATLVFELLLLATYTVLMDVLDPQMSIYFHDIDYFIAFDLKFEP